MKNNKMHKRVTWGKGMPGSMNGFGHDGGTKLKSSQKRKTNVSTEFLSEIEKRVTIQSKKK